MSKELPMKPTGTRGYESGTGTFRVYLKIPKKGTKRAKTISYPCTGCHPYTPEEAIPIMRMFEAKGFEVYAGNEIETFTVKEYDEMWAECEEIEQKESQTDGWVNVINKLPRRK